MSKPHIRIHYEHGAKGCRELCVGNTVGCWSADVDGRNRSVCCNWNSGDEGFTTWFELISGDINGLKKDKE